MVHERSKLVFDRCNKTDAYVLDASKHSSMHFDFASTPEIAAPVILMQLILNIFALVRYISSFK